MEEADIHAQVQFLHLVVKMVLMNWQISTIYIIIIGVEIFISNFQQRRLYTWRETLVSFVLSIVNGTLDLAIRGTYMIILIYLYRFRITYIENPFIYWVLLFLMIDFQFYWLHRIEHYCRLFWAAHVTHHSAKHMNFTVGFRASLMRPLYDFMFFLPIVFFGFKPLDIFLTYSIAQIWAVFQHTELVRKLGWLEYVFVTPSHHRVHHASNEKYLDKNMGMVLIIWDRLFGTFQEELSNEEYEPIRYGLTKPLADESIKSVMFGEWINIYKDVKQNNITLKQKLKYIFGRPGWKHS